MSPAIPVLAVLGGTFDPIHYGHLRLAADVRALLGIAEVRLVPAARPPHRVPPIAAAEHRLAMTALGCAEFPGLVVDAREIERAGPSYTVDTLESLREEAAQQPLALLIGTDAFLGLAGWSRWERLFELAHFLVVPRPGTRFAPEALPPELAAQWRRRLTTDAMRLAQAPAGSILRVPVTPQRISASAIRAALARGETGRKTVRGLLPAGVLAYIDRNQLYRSVPDAT